MKIGIDGRALQGKRAGIGRYVFELCRELDRLLPEAQFFVYSNVDVELPVQSKRWILRVDTFPFAAKMKLVVWHKNPQRNFSQTANFVVSNSYGTSKRLAHFTGRSSDCIVYPGVDSTFSRQALSHVQRTLDGYGINSPYLLAVATWEPRKNLELLITSFLKLKSAGFLADFKLILVGGRGWKDHRLAALLDGVDSVVPLGYVPDADLPALYSGAELFVFPSVYEGFGIPVLEAVACGTKVVATDVPEIREAGGNSNCYFSLEGDGLFNAILQHIGSEVAPAQIDMNRFTWEANARKLAAIFRSAS